MFKKHLIIPSMLSLILLISCSEDNIEPTGNNEARPTFDNLTISALSGTQTPYEEIFKSGGNTNGRLQDSDDIRRLMDKMEEIFPDFTYIDEIESEQIRGVDVWEVEIELPDDDDLEFYISKDLFEVVKIEGDDVDLPYELDPGDSFITLNEAVGVARRALEGNDIEFDDWDLSFDDDRWIYEFEMENPDDVEVYVNANTGELIGVYDDDDDDDDNDDD
ncbi:MAG: PepSY domain-containing protein [Cyclobacteriaceae bacterium]